MRQEIEAQVLTIFVGEEDKWRTGLLYPAIVDELNKLGVAGVTVIHGMEGFGSHHRLHTARFEVLFSKLPVVIEAVDRREKIDEALAVLDSMIKSGLVTVHDVRAIKYTE